MREHFGIDGGLKACVAIVWLVLAGAAVAVSTDDSERAVATGALALAALAGALRPDWRESLALGLAGAALTVWLVSGDAPTAGPVVVGAAVILTAAL